MKKNDTLFILVFVIFLISGVTALCLFRAHASDPEPAAAPAVLVAQDQNQEQDQPDVPDTKPEPPTEPVPEPEAEAASEPEAEPAEPDAQPETDTAPETKPEAEPETGSEPENEPADTPESEPEEAEYDTYTVVPSDVTGVRVRKTSDRESEVIALLNGGDTGIVLETGKNRTKILLPDGSAGYVFNEYLEISEPHQG